VIDPNGYSRTRVSDDLGRVIRIDEDSQQGTPTPTTATAPYQRPGTAVSTSYLYGPFGVLNQVSLQTRDSQGGGTWTLSVMNHDDLGRVTSVVDADSGQSSTTYDALGEITSATDGNGDMHVPARDVLGRTVADYSTKDGATYYQDDTALNGIGKLGSATSPDGVTTSYGYFQGLPASTTWTIPSYGTYAFSTPRNEYGQVAAILYPNGANSVSLTYDQAGAQSGASVSGQPAELSWQATGWQPDGKLTQETYGVSGDGDSGTTTRVYDPNRGRLTQISTVATTAAGGVAVQQISYSNHDANGNLTERDDGLTGTTETFHNDFLNRLDTWSFTSSSPFATTTTTSFGYDDLGNLQTRNSTTSVGASNDVTYWSGTPGGPLVGEAGIHALSSTSTGAAYGYDSKGNQTSAPGRTVGYSSFSLPKSVTTAEGTTTFLYDANHQRVVKQGPSETTISVGGLYEQRIGPSTASITGGGLSTNKNPTVTVCYVPGGNRIVAQTMQSTKPLQESVTVSYLHDDVLGSVESITGTEQTWNSSGAFTYLAAPTQHLKYDPFGQRIDPNNGTPTTVPANPSSAILGFTEQEHDDDLGLINMRGRIYDPSVARFLSVDPITDWSGQGLNGYSYVGNNPLNFTDPSGFDKKGDAPMTLCGSDPMPPGQTCTTPVMEMQGDAPSGTSTQPPPTQPPPTQDSNGLMAPTPYIGPGVGGIPGGGPQYSPSIPEAILTTPPYEGPSLTNSFFPPPPTITPSLTPEHEANVLWNSAFQQAMDARDDKVRDVIEDQIAQIHKRNGQLRQIPTMMLGSVAEVETGVDEVLEAAVTRRLATMGDTQFRTAGDALAEALERHGIDPSTVETTTMYGKNPNLLGPQGQSWEMVRGLNSNGELIEFENHANGHFFGDTNEFELPHYHGPDGEHLTY